MPSQAGNKHEAQERTARSPFGDRVMRVRHNSPEFVVTQCASQLGRYVELPHRRRGRGAAARDPILVKLVQADTMAIDSKRVHGQDGTRVRGRPREWSGGPAAVSDPAAAAHPAIRSGGSFCSLK